MLRQQANAICFVKSDIYGWLSTLCFTSDQIGFVCSDNIFCCYCHNNNVNVLTHFAFDNSGCWKWVTRKCSCCFLFITLFSSWKMRRNHENHCPSIITFNLIISHMFCLSAFCLGMWHPIYMSCLIGTHKGTTNAAIQQAWNYSRAHTSNNHCLIFFYIETFEKVHQIKYD